MPYFRVVFEGSGIDFKVGADRAKGFYAVRYFRAHSEAVAVEKAKADVAAEWATGCLQSLHASPVLTLIHVENFGFMRGFLLRQPKYAFFSESHAVLLHARDPKLRSDGSFR
ncbi:MAG: hypothetical protein ABI588_08765 [Arenimonas sp.]